jgi:hypothetical protein
MALEASAYYKKERAHEGGNRAGEKEASHIVSATLRSNGAIVKAE